MYANIQFSVTHTHTPWVSVECVNAHLIICLHKSFKKSEEEPFNTEARFQIITCI